MRLLLPCMAALATAVVGCSSPSGSDLDRARSWRTGSSVRGWGFYGSPDEAERPKLRLGEAEIAAALDESRRIRSHDEAAARAQLADASLEDVAGVASAVRLCYRLGARDFSSTLLGRGVYSWDQAGRVADIDCHYSTYCVDRRWGGEVLVKARRKDGVSGPLAISFPPGTYVAFADSEASPEGEPRGDGWTRPDDDRRYGHWPSVQDLAFLEAPVLVIPEGADTASVSVPIACASFRAGPPVDRMHLALRRFRPGSEIDRVMIALCARGEDDAEKASEAQIAVWLARNDISYREFRSAGRLVTFEGRPVQPAHAEGAARILLKAGLDPRQTRFFSGREDDPGHCVPARDQVEPESPPVSTAPDRASS